MYRWQQVMSSSRIDCTKPDPIDAYSTSYPATVIFVPWKWDQVNSKTFSGSFFKHLNHNFRQYSRAKAKFQTCFQSLTTRTMVKTRAMTKGHSEEGTNKKIMMALLRNNTMLLDHVACAPLPVHLRFLNDFPSLRVNSWGSITYNTNCSNIKFMET